MTELGTRARTRIKICGLRREADVDAAVDAGADAVGFVLWPGSVRHVELPRAAALARRLPPFVQPVLLFVDADAGDVQRALDAVPAALVQFHGNETAAQCEAASRRAGTAQRYLRAVRMRAGVDLLDCAAAHPHAAALLLDADVEGFGGGGKPFDWSLATQGVALPVVLSGGLNPANVTDGIGRLRPWAVDVSSGVESRRGVKDAALIRRFCEAVRQADAHVSRAIES